MLRLAFIQQVPTRRGWLNRHTIRRGAQIGLAWLILFLSIGLGSAPAKAATVPSGFVDSTVGGALSNATAMEFAPDGRLFVLQQGGQVKIIKNGTLLGTNFLSLTVDSSGERGLLGITFDPNFTSNNYVYLYYTVPGSPAHNRFSRFTANGDVAVPNSEVILIDLENLSSATNHNGGAMHFGPDGKLYVAVGENAFGNNAQTLTNRLGKILRYNADGSIPTDNPFYNTATGANRAIWALGLRNPFTFAFQPGSSRLYINDVGQGTWEEINDGVAGANYGWPTTEGPTTNQNFKTPFYWYAHSGGSGPNGCAITGGAFYNPVTAQFPTSYVGKYFFADYCSGWIYYVTPGVNGNPPAVTEFATGIDAPVDLKVSPDGALYYLRRSGVSRITYPGGQVAPTISTDPTSKTVATGQTATFTVSANGTPPLRYQWQKNTVDIPGATSNTYTTPAAVIGDNGTQYRCVVSNAFGSATSQAATLTVTQRQPPTAQITAPTDGTLFSGGQVFNYAGAGSDAVDGTLPASAFSWLIVLHHDQHTHPFLGPINGVKNGSFTIPTVGHTETTIFYRVTLTVTNSANLSSSVSVDLDPRLVTLTFGSNPTGLQVTLDGQPFTTPFIAQSVVGVTRSLGAPGPQALSGRTYNFTAWSDSGTQTHNVSTPTTATTYTATYTQVYRPDTIGVYQSGSFHLRNTNSAGPADFVIRFGETGWYPVTGDWNGDGVDTIGVLNPSTAMFYLRNSNSPGSPDYSFIFGNPADLPLAGRWDATMNGDGVGVYRPANGIVYLKRVLVTGYADYAMVLGNPGDLPLAGDWDKNGYASVGILRPTSGMYYLSNTVGNGVIFSDVAFSITGATGSVLPISGDWTGTGVNRVGFFKGGTVGLRMALSSGAPDTTFIYGASDARPVAGHWTALSSPPPLILVGPVVAPAQPTEQAAPPVTGMD